MTEHNSTTDRTQRFLCEHAGHKIMEESACDIHDGMITCWDCGDRLITSKYPIEYITMTLEFAEEKAKAGSDIEHVGSTCHPTTSQR
jgi:hypothetical protein